MHSALWSILQQFIRQGLVAAFVFVLARRVTPTEFGLIGIANVWNNFLYLFLELGFAAALVQRKEITSAHIASAALLNILCGAAITMGSILAAGPLSLWMNAPDAGPVIRAVSISFLVSSVASTQIALAQRALKFKELALRDFAANSIAAAVGILLALQGYGVWAVVANSILLNILIAVFVWRITPHRILFGNVTEAAIGSVWRFGASVLGYTGLKYFLRSADSILVGILFGPEKLGLYNFAQRVTTAPTKSVQVGLASFLFPRAAKSQDEQGTLAELFTISFKLLNHLLLIFAILMVTVGAKLLLIVFGAQWQAAVEIIQLLILIQLLAPAIIPLAELLKATNRPNWLLTWTLLQTLLSAAGLAIGSIYGFRGSLIGFVISFWATTPLLYWLARAVTGANPSEFWTRVRLSYFLGAASAAVSLFIVKQLANHPIAIGFAVFTVIVVHVGIIYFADPDLARLSRMIKRRFGGGP